MCERKRDAPFRNGAELGERHDLIAAGIGQDWPVPAHEAMKAAKARDALGARPQHQMIGVAQDDVRARRLDVVEEHRLDRRRGAHRHESGRPDRAPWRCDLAEPRAAILGEKLEGKRRGHEDELSARLSRQASP